MCYGGRKTREERKTCPKIRLFGFPQRLVIRSATTTAHKVVSSSRLIGRSIWIWAHAQIQRPLALALKFKWTNQTWGWNHLASSRCDHTPLRKTEEANFKAFFRSSRVFRPPKHTYLEWNLLGFMELLVLLRFGTEEKAICGVTSGQRWMEWSALPFF